MMLQSKTIVRPHNTSYLDTTRIQYTCLVCGNVRVKLYDPVAWSESEVRTLVRQQGSRFMIRCSVCQVNEDKKKGPKPMNRPVLIERPKLIERPVLIENTVDLLSNIPDGARVFYTPALADSWANKEGKDLLELGGSKYQSWILQHIEQWLLDHDQIVLVQQKDFSWIAYRTERSK